MSSLIAERKIFMIRKNTKNEVLLCYDHKKKLNNPIHREYNNNNNINNNIISDDNYDDEEDEDAEIVNVYMYLNDNNNDNDKNRKMTMRWVPSCNLHYTDGKYWARRDPTYKLHICKYFKGNNLMSCRKKHRCAFAHIKDQNNNSLKEKYHYH